MKEKVEKQPKVAILKWLNPAGMLEQELEKVAWYQALIISGLAFGLLFWQTGLDQREVKEIGIWGIAILTGKGILLGTVGMAMIGFVVWLVIHMVNQDWSLSQSVKQLSLSYTAPLFGLLIGLILNLVFGSNTAIAFGITGVLWSLNPMFRMIKKASKDQFILSLVLTTVIGLLVMLAWDFFV